jgi:hypothetical protein
MDVNVQKKAVMKRPYRIKICLGFSELALINQRAKSTGKTTARYIRETVLGKEHKLKQFTPESKKAFIEITGISRNINQLTRLFNGGSRDFIELDLLKNKLQKIIDNLTGNNDGDKNETG